MARRAAISLAAAICTYFAQIFAVLAITMAQGGGISCYQNCTPTQESMDDAARSRSPSQLWSVI